MRLFITSLLLISFSVFRFVNAQVTTDPAVPTADQPVTLTFDATGTGLDGYDGDVYAHTGLTVDGNQWQYVIGDWGNNTNQPQFTKIGTNLYELEMTPSIRDFYGAAANDNIEEICLVIRSADGTQQTNPDIFIQVFEIGLNVVLISPDVSPFFVDPGQSIDISAEATLATTLSLYVDDELITSTTESVLNETITAATDEDTKHWIKVVAEDGTNTAADSIYYYVRGLSTVEDLPAGVKDGINYIDEQTVTLVVHAPYKNSIYVIGDFNDWQVGPEFKMKSNKADVNDFDTRYWVTISNLTPGEEYGFQYLIDENLRVADAYTDKVLDKWNDPYITDATYPNLKPYPVNKTDHIVSVLQTNQPDYPWQVTNFEAPEPTDLVVYELLVRDFVDAHDFQTLTDSISYFKRLGINAIEVMPFSEFEGNLSWGYNPSFYFAPDKYYGPKDAVKGFIDACHAEGIAVIIDMVLNHAYGQNVFARMYWDEENNRPAANNPWFNATCPNEYCWGNDFNHESPATQAFVDRVTEYWLTEYKLDGIRFDYTKGFTNNSGGWSYDQERVDIIERIADHIWEVKDNAYVIIEHWTDNREEKVLAEYGCMPWGNINYNYNEGTMGYNEEGKSDFSWISYQDRGWNVPHVMGYMESHDEERLMYKNLAYGNSAGNYNVTDTTTALERQALAATFFYTIPGPKMIWQFGERGYDYSINWPSGTEDDRLSPKPPRWDYMNDYRREYLYHVNAALIGLKKDYDVFRTTDFSLDLYNATKSITLRGSDMNVVVVGNFDVVSQDHAPDWPNTGTWYEYYTQTDLDVTSTNQTVSLAPGEYRIYTSQYITKPAWLNTSIEEPAGTENTHAFSIYPNPVNDEMNFRIELTNPSDVTVKIFDVMGKLISTINREDLQNGVQEISWHTANSLKSGIYFAMITTGERVETIKFAVE